MYKVDNEGIPTFQCATSGEDTESSQKKISLVEYRQKVTDKYLHRRKRGVDLSEKDMEALEVMIAKRNVEMLMVYVPEFLGEIKAAIKTGEVEEKLSALKEVPVLILDDIGAESLSSWIRDDVLGAI